MSQYQPSEQAWNSGMEFWTKLWHQQFEQSLKFWSLWAQTLPHETARELAAEAEAQKKTPAKRAPARPRSRAKTA